MNSNYFKVNFNNLEKEWVFDRKILDIFIGIKIN